MSNIVNEKPETPLRLFRSALTEALGLDGEAASTFNQRVNRKVTGITSPQFLRECTDGLNIGDGTFWDAINTTFKIWRIKRGMDIGLIEIPASIKFHMLRKKHRLTGNALAKIINIDNRTIRRWEAIGTPTARDPNPAALRILEWIDSGLLDLDVLIDTYVRKD